MKHEENVPRRVAVLQLGGKWVGEKVVPGASFVRFQGTIEDCLKIGGRGGSGSGSGVSVRHMGVKRRVVVGIRGWEEMHSLA